MTNRNLYKFFIITFAILYAATAGISFFHAIEFFNIGNVKWMSVTLAAVFEVGQATVLASLLLSDNNKAIMPWILMILLTTVQIIGNVYSTYKFMALSDINYYQYLEKPLLFWANGISQDTVMVIISYIIGALLPIVALCMTSMAANNIKLQSNINNSHEDLMHPEGPKNDLVKSSNSYIGDKDGGNDVTVPMTVYKDPRPLFNPKEFSEIINENENAINTESHDKTEDVQTPKSSRHIRSVEFN